MNADELSERIDALEQFFPEGFVLVARTGAQEYLLHKHDPREDRNLRLIAEHLERSFEDEREE